MNRYTVLTQLFGIGTLKAKESKMYREFVDSREGFSDDERAAYEAEYNDWLDAVEELESLDEEIRHEEEELKGIFQWF